MKIGDIAEVVRGSSPRPQGDPRYYDGTVPRLMVADITRDGKNVTPQIDSLTLQGAELSRPMKKGDMVIAVSGNPGLPAILAVDACIHDGFVGLRNLDSSKIDVDYLYRFLLYQKGQTGGQAVGAIFKNLTSDQIREIGLPLPPLPEQKRIAAILDKADSIRRKRQESVRLTEELLRSVFLDMFGDPVTNPKGWETQAFSDVCETRLGKMLDANQQTGEHLRPYLRNSNVQWDRIEITDLEQMDFDEKNRKTFSLKDGDVLICEGGEVGRAAIWRNQLTDCYFQKAIHRARPNQNLAQPEYVMFWLWFMAKNGGFKDHVTSATIAHLTGQKLKEIQMVLPPITMQHQFLRIYNSIKKLKRNTTTYQSETESLFNTILQRAFKG